MFTIANRLRGTKAYFSKVIGVLIGSLFYAFTSDIYTSILLTIGYVLGESFGWGKWIGGIINDSEYTEELGMDKEGRTNGIHWLTERIYKEEEDYQDYCQLALMIRGGYWGLLTLLPLLVFGYIGIVLFLLSVFFAGFFFTLSVHIGKYTTTKFNFGKYGFNMHGAWEHSEVWYGLLQDVIVIVLVVIAI